MHELKEIMCDNVQKIQKYTSQHKTGLPASTYHKLKSS